jgi:hypothetical protein
MSWTDEVFGKGRAGRIADLTRKFLATKLGGSPAA